MALDWCRNLIYAQYFVAQLMDFDKICKCFDIDEM